jgi:prevent-host-death family protein
MPNVDIKQAENCFTDLVDQAIEGHEIIITREGRPVVKLIAIGDKNKRKRQFGSAKGLIEISDDFDDTPEDFRDYM